MLIYSVSVIKPISKFCNSEIMKIMRDHRGFVLASKKENHEMVSELERLYVVLLIITDGSWDIYVYICVESYFGVFFCP